MLEAAGETQARLGRLDRRQRAFHVAVLSGLGLFFELLLIRWLDSQVRPLAFVKNLPLIASFLGLGIGFAIAGRWRTSLPLSIILLSLVLSLGLGLSGPTGLVESGPPGPESNLGLDSASAPLPLLVFYLAVTGAFALTVIATIPLGQAAGEYMAGMPPLQAYTANILGALAGVLLTFLLAAGSAPPWLATLLGFAVLLAYLWRSPLRRWSMVVGLLVVLAMIVQDRSPGRPTVWSPYNKIQTESLTDTGVPWRLSVQNLYYQRIIDLRPQTLAAHPGERTLQHWQRFYDFPYQWRQAGKVLVLGAGTGNDVAAALRAGAERVDAIEIDPLILGYGHELHPERPYQDRRVRAIAADARAYLRSTTERYDVIVFALLDAHTSLYSSLGGSIRLDNYVYTIEAFRQALSRLSDDGILYVAVYVERPFVGARIAKMLSEAWGRTPLIHRPSLTFLAGPGVPPEGRGEVRPLTAADLGEPGLPMATDDWPFLYLESRQVPPAILWAGLGVLLVSLLTVGGFFRGQAGIDRQFLLLGAGFLLVETRSIAALGLIYGTTWRVSAVTIAVILGLILLANLAIARTGPWPRRPLYLALGVALLANYAFPAGIAVGAGPLASAAMAVFLLLPLLFAALIFASLIAGQAELGPILASNLLGGVAGGLLENLSMVVGISALSLVALAVYLASLRDR